MICLSVIGSSHPVKEGSGAISMGNVSLVSGALIFNFIKFNFKCKLTAWSFLI